jgi:hypothetical protein
MNNLTLKALVHGDANQGNSRTRDFYFIKPLS